MATTAPRSATGTRNKRVAGNPWITPKLFRFLRELADNNRREWFNANKQRYHDEVRDPLLELIEILGPGLHRISPYLLADPRPVGGSLFRIYRDTRFAKDKSPYKTHAGLHFGHSDVDGMSAPGLYLHLEPGSVFTAAGIWHPDTASLRSIRDAIAERPTAFKRAIAPNRAPLDDGNRLVRPPRGFDREHPLIEDLKRKSFTSSVSFTQRDACASDFPDRLIRAWRGTSPLMEFLAGSIGVDW